MENKRFLLGMLVVALVFGMTVVGCEDESTDESGKSITITGIIGKSGDVALYLFSAIPTSGGQDVAGIGSISNNSVTIPLMNLSDDKKSVTTPWTGSGSYFIYLQFFNSLDDQIYTNGTASPVKYSISSATSTIAYSQFKSYFDDE
jgi:hypothetical protein